jgi:hypothetical protein
MDDPVGVHPIRLFAVADLVLEIIERRGGALGLLELATAPLEDAELGSAGLPTQLELEEAVTLLIRLGFVERVDRSGSA